MKTKTKIASAVIVSGLAISPVAHAASIIDFPDKAGNTIQANAGGDKVQPQFALWPLSGPNTSTIHIESNDATNRGDNTTGIPFLLGNGAGNIIQISTGGNVLNPQGAIGTNNISHIETYGNWAVENGTDSSTSVTGGQVLGHVVDGNGNVLQVEFLQGNVVNPQFAFLGDNTSVIDTRGNVADGNGSGSDTASAGALAFVDGNGNVVQFVILSHNVINPQVSVGGSNTLLVFAKGNEASGNGNDASTTATGFSGILAITTSTTGSGNVTQIAILSNNVWAPQLILPGPDGKGGTNTGNITTDTNAADDNGNGSDTTVHPVPRPTPVIDALRTVVSPLTGGHTPVLDAVQSAVQSTNGAKIGSGNVDQHAAGDGIIDNPQINLANQKTPDVVNEPTPEPEEKPVLVRDSFIAVPGATGDNDKKTPKVNHPASNWKPGDGIKKIVNKIHDVLHPKPKADSDSAPA